MHPKAQMVWASLEFRKPAMLRLLEPLSYQEMLWLPAQGRNSIAWQLWHIAEVEDNWVRHLVCGQAKRYPFGLSVREARLSEYPDKPQLLAYFHEVRALTRKRLEEATEEDFDRTVHDPDFGELRVCDVWAGVVTSFAWHAGQIALTERLLAATENMS